MCNKAIFSCQIYTQHKVRKLIFLFNFRLFLKLLTDYKTQGGEIILLILFIGYFQNSLQITNHWKTPQFKFSYNNEKEENIYFYMYRK
jgi:hypothetical protein